MRLGVNSYKARARTPHRRGVVLVLVALLLIVIVGMLGLAIDTLFVVRTAQQLQNAADASALAGALLVRGDAADTVAKALSIAAANSAAGASVELHPVEGYLTGEVILGRYYRKSAKNPEAYFEPTLDSPNAVSVLAQRTAGNGHPLALLFAPILGVHTIDVSRDAIAMIGGGTGSGLIVLSETAEPALYIHGDLHLSVSGGDIQVNSAAVSAAVFQGSFTLDAPNVNMQGTYDTVGRAGEFVDTNLNTGRPVVQDPLADIPEPDLGDEKDLIEGINYGGDLALTEGYYPGGIQLTGGGNVTLAPGIYAIGGPGFSVSGNVNLTGDGVMLYLVGSAALSLQGEGVTHLTGIESGIYEGITIFQSRSNTATNDIRGTSGLDVSGTIYLPAAKLNLTGTSDKIGTQLIANEMEISGNGVLTINYDGRNPAPGNKVFLVE